MNGLNVAYLASATILSLGGIVFTGVRLVAAFKKRWLEDQENTRALKDNTKAIERFTDLFQDHERRIDALEHR